MLKGHGFGGIPPIRWNQAVRRRGCKNLLTVFCASLLASLFFFTSSSFALTLIFSDFDDTITESRQSRDGSFETTHKLFLIKHRSNTLQNEAEGPDTIEVGPQDFERIKEHLGKGNRDHGAVGMKVTLKSGLVIVPGNYMIVDPETYERYGSIEGRNPLLEDYDAAVVRDPEGKWKGEFWHKMTFYLNHPELHKSFGVLTARKHKEMDWAGLFERWKKEGHIKYAPANPKLTHNVTLAEYNRFNINGDVPTLKTAILRERLTFLQRTAHTSQDMRLDIDGKGQAQLHYIIVADDNQRTVELMTELFQEFTRNRIVEAKFAIFNMGTDTQVKESGRPRYAIVEAGGTLRHAKAREILGEPVGLTEEQAKDYLSNPTAYCSALLGVKK